jgi:ketosteroid isomerase-like protein
VEVHPYRSAWQTRDLAAWEAALAPDVELHSPIFSSPFRGREAAIELFEVLFRRAGRVEITHEFSSGNTHAFFWRVDFGGRLAEGVDLIRSDQHGKVAEIRVSIRPLSGIAAFGAAVGPPLAGKRGALRAPLLRVLMLPFNAILALADVVASRLVQRR